MTLNNIKCCELIEEKEIPRKELISNMDITYTTLKSILDGKRKEKVSLDTVFSLADSLGVNYKEILNDWERSNYG